MPEPTDPQTTMSEAFARAGHESPAMRLRRMMREAIGAGGGRFGPTCDYFVAALAKANDAALIWELFVHVRMREITRLFEYTLADMRAAKAPLDADGKVKSVLPQGRLRGASPSAPNADEKANGFLPQGQTHGADSSAPSSEDHEANPHVPQGHDPNASPSERQPDAQAKSLPPTVGPSDNAQRPAAAPIPREPSRAAINAMIHVARRHSAYEFKITVNGRPMSIGDVAVSSYDNLIQEAGKRVLVSGAEYNLLRGLRNYVAKQAFIPEGATTRDIISGHDVGVMIATSTKLGELPVVIVPKELATNA